MIISQKQTPNTKLLECLNEYFKANGELTNFLYVKGFSELCNPLANKGYEIMPMNGSNCKKNGELVIADFNNLNLENKTPLIKYWILNKPNKIKLKWK